MLLMGKRTRTVGKRVLRALLLGQLLPVLLLTPGQAGAALLHSHCELSHHVHVLHGVEFVKWGNGHAAEHHCATEESDICCEASVPGDGPDGVVLQRPPMLVCRARSIETTLPQPTVDVAPPNGAATCFAALHDAADACKDRCAPRRCLDALLSSSHALLI
jgi:hypothetical protein